MTALADLEGVRPRARKRSRSREKSLNHKKARQEEDEIHLEYINGQPFSVDAEGFVVVYTDGSCFNNGQASACAGYGVYFGDNHLL